MRAAAWCLQLVGTSGSNATVMSTRLLDRIGNPLTWGETDKALIVQAIAFPGILAGTLRARYILTHPAVEPYYDRATFARLTWIMSGFLLVTVGLTLLGVWIRRTGRGSRVYLHVVNQSWWLTFAVLTYMHGLATTPLWIFFPLLGLYCLLLFDATLTIAGALTALTVIYGTTIAERLGVLPYAPLFLEPFGKRVPNTWLWSSMLWPVAVSGITFVVFGFIFARARRHERQVEELVDLLKRMFGRYISTEVMKTLLDRPSTLALGGERRRVTILMTDLRGFTSLSERLPPEDVIAVLNAYFEVMVEVCLRRHATINEL